MVAVARHPNRSRHSVRNMTAIWLCSTLNLCPNQLGLLLFSGFFAIADPMYFHGRECCGGVRYSQVLVCPPISPEINGKNSSLIFAIAHTIHYIGQRLVIDDLPYKPSVDGTWLMHRSRLLEYNWPWPAWTAIADQCHRWRNHCQTILTKFACLYLDSSTLHPVNLHYHHRCCCSDHGRLAIASSNYFQNHHRCRCIRKCFCGWSAVDSGMWHCSLLSPPGQRSLTLVPPRRCSVVSPAVYRAHFLWKIQNFLADWHCLHSMQLHLFRKSSWRLTFWPRSLGHSYYFGVGLGGKKTVLMNSHSARSARWRFVQKQHPPTMNPSRYLSVNIEILMHLDRLCLQHLLKI